MHNKCVSPQSGDQQRELCNRCERVKSVQFRATVKIGNRYIWREKLHSKKRLRNVTSKYWVFNKSFESREIRHNPTIRYICLYKRVITKMVRILDSKKRPLVAIVYNLHSTQPKTRTGRFMRPTAYDMIK